MKGTKKWTPLTKVILQRILAVKPENITEHHLAKRGIILPNDTIEAILALRNLYGAKVANWPTHFIDALASDLSVEAEANAVSNGGSNDASNDASNDDSPLIFLADNFELPIGNVSHTQLPQFVAGAGINIGEANITEKSTDTTPGNSQTKVSSFDLLGEDDHERIRDIYYSDMQFFMKFAKLHELYGIGQRTAQRWFTELGLTNKRREPDFIKRAKERTITSKLVLITSAQCATPIHAELWENMCAYAAHIGAEIHVIPYRYKNPTSHHSDLGDDYWDPRIIPYLTASKNQFGDNLFILGNLRVQPTAELPLSDIHAISPGKSAIVGHPKMHMVSVPVQEGDHRQKFWSTGSLTVENYTDSKAGLKGESHHSLGFIIVELDSHPGGDTHHVRHVPATEDGSFQDLWWAVKDARVTYQPSATSLVLGDLHVGDHDPLKVEASVKLYHKLNPDHVILHDVFNGHSVNHHENKTPTLKFHNIKAGRAYIGDEIDQLIHTLSYLQTEFAGAEIAVVRSNHDEFLDRYIQSANWQHDLLNAEEYAKYLLYLLQTPPDVCKGIIPKVIQDRLPGIVCLTRDDSYKPGAYQLSNHGDIGVSGSRGTPRQYSRLNSKQITGHTHSPCRLNGLLVVGTSTYLRVGYNVGPCSWDWADVIEYPNGKATHIVYDSWYNFTTLSYPG